MILPVIISSRARAGLYDIFVYIALDNPTRAEIFIEALEQKCLKLSDMWQTYPYVPELEKQEIRQCHYKNYRIFYQIIANEVWVTHVVHGSRDYQTLLNDAE